MGASATYNGNTEYVMRRKFKYSKALASTALVVMAISVAGCKTTSRRGDVTGSIGSIGPRGSAVEFGNRNHGTIDQLAERYRANPKDAAVAHAYGQALRSAGQRAQASAVYEQATLANPGNRELLAGYGRALADNGQLQRAFDVLSKAHAPDAPDWRILSVQGAVLDQMGKHDDARRYYSSALKIRPEDPSVLSNLGLSYMLSRDLPAAEAVLRRAHANPSADPRVRQNLGLVIGLQGRFDEAEAIVRADLPAEEAASNVAYLRQMLNGPDGRSGNRQTAAAALAR